MENAILREIVDKVKITPKSGLLPNKISTRLFVLIAITVMAFVGFGETTYTETVDGVDYSYTISSGKATITSAKAGSKTVLQIPSFLGGYDVVSIGSSAFYGCSGLTSVTIPSSVKRIDGDAFSGCTALRDVVMSKGLVKIGGYAFNECRSLKCINIPNTVEVIEGDAFRNCMSLTNCLVIPKGMKEIQSRAFEYSGFRNVVIGDNITKIGMSAFEYSSLREVVLPSSLKNIGNKAFYYCYGLTNVVFNECVPEMEGQIFYGCTSLMSVSLPFGLRKIPSNMFSLCRSLTSLDFPDSIREMENGCFSGSGLKKIKFPESLLRIGTKSFYQCSALESAIMPSSIQSIGDDAFAECYSLKVNFTGQPPQCGTTSFRGCLSGTYSAFSESWQSQLVNGMWNALPMSCLTTQYNGGPYKAMVAGVEWTYILVDGAVILCGDTELSPCVTQTISGDVSVPATVAGRQVLSIAKGAFLGCDEIISVSIPEGVRNVAGNVFDGCKKLRTITIPATAVNIGSLSDCVSLEEISIAPNNPCYCCIDDVLYDKNIETLVRCPPLKSDVTLPESLMEIADYGFADCVNLSVLRLPEKYLKIGANAFRNCIGLQEISKLRCFTISEGAFYGCKSLSRVEVVGDTIMQDAFNGCENLRFAVVDVYYIHNRAFKDCLSLELVFERDPFDVAADAFEGCVAGYYATDRQRWESFEIQNGMWCGLKMTPLPVPTEEPWGGTAQKPSSDGVSLYDVVSVYDGKEHTIDVENLSKFPIYGGAMPILSYAVQQSGEYKMSYNVYDDNHNIKVVPLPWTWKNAGETSIWYRVNNCLDYSHEVKVTIRQRDVILKSGSAIKNYDGTALCCDDAFAEGFVDGEGVAISCCGCQTDVGSSANDFTYAFNQGTLASNYSPQRQCGVLTVTATGIVTIAYGVKEIPARALKDCVEVTEIQVPESVENIGDDAFAGCSGLKRIAFPSQLALRWDDLRRIGLTDEFVRKNFAQGDWVVVDRTLLAYIGDQNVSELTVPHGIEIIDEGAFSGLRNLRKIGFCGTEKEIGSFAFRGCIYLDGVVLPDSVEVIGEGAFSGCSHILDFSMGNGVREIGVGAFEGCQAIEDLVCSESVLVVGARAFANCYYLRNIVLPLCVTNVAETAFAECISLVDVTMPTHVAPLSRWFPLQYEGVLRVAIPDGETVIRTGTLKGCANVTEVRIPESVQYIGDDAFAGCTGLKKIVFPSRMELRWSELRRIGLRDEFVRAAFVQGDWLVAGCVLLAYVGDPNVSELMVPDGIEIIEEEVFAGLYNLQKIHFCGTEKEIGPFAFRDCTYLDDVVLPDTVEVLGEGAFSGCSYIFDFDMGNGVREIGESAFEGCQTIENMVCSTNLLDVGRRAFADCYYLRDVALPLGVTNVATSAFAGCAALTGVTVPTHVVPLSRWFPEQYKSICSVTIPDDETEMVPSMFEGCQSLGIDPVDGAESIILPEGLTVIPDRAFADCSSIVQLTLPTGVVSIGEAAFERCQFVAFAMPDAVTIVGKGAFRGCSALKDVTLGKSLVAIPDELFAGCSSLDSFTVPGSVTQLGENFVPYQTSAIYFMGNAPAYAENAYDSANVHALVNYVKRGTMGWNGQPTGRVLPTPAVWPVNTTVAITYWEANQFDAVFDANGGYFENPESTTFACKETTFESYAIPPYDPIRPGYVFTGWWTDPMGGSRIRATTRVTLTKSNGEVQTIYAHWKKGDAKIVTIRFNAMGGTVNPPYTNCVAGSVYGNALKSVVPTKEYYDFYGWYTMAYWPDGELQTAESIVPDADRELFARWEAKTYVVRYHANGGTGTMEDGSFVYGDKFNLASNRFQRVGHVFAGWASTSEGEKKYNDRALLSDFGAIEDGVIDLYAVWVEVDCFYSIRYDSNGGVGYMTNQTVRIGDTVALDPNRFTREGYAFVGWALRADDYEKVYDDQERVCNLSEKDGDTVALFAVWVKEDGEVAVPVVSTVDGTTFFGESGRVTITCATAGATIYYAIGASPRAADRYVYSGPFTISETSTVYAFAKKGDKKTDTVKVVITKRTLTLAEAIGAEDLLVTTGGLTGWGPVVDDTAAKGVSARSGIMKAAEPGEWNESWMEIVVDGPGTLTFRWKVDCEWNESGDCTWDHLAYFIDNADTDSARIDGMTAWEGRSVTFETPGPHSIRWVFAKDDYDDEFDGEDCGWIDEVTWTPLAQGVVVPAEVTGGKEIVVDEAWPASLDAQFGTGTSAAFVEKFGSDLSAALLKSTGKKNAAGEDMYVWQDYVAGTDPTDLKSQFTAQIEMVNGEPVVVWSPKLSEAEAAKRIYTTYGKRTLEASEPWTPVETPAQGGWRFFKVGVEMR